MATYKAFFCATDHSMNAPFTGVEDYNQLVNKPSINGVELKGDLTTEDLHIIAGGGVDYEQLTNKPQIEGIELSGNRTFEQLGIKPMSVTDIEKILYL